jgi:phosphate transport system permease protein
MTGVTRLIAHRKWQDRAFQVFGILCTLVGIATLAALLIKLAVTGLPVVLRSSFFLANASYLPAKAGILMALVGSLCVMLVTFSAAVPLGIAAAVYLEEYARKNWLTNLIEINISNLAGVPSITYGLMSLWLFGYLLGLTSSIAVGGLTLALLVLPIIIVTTREAIRSIPSAIREAAYASGATKWQTIRYHLLPYSLGGIATGTIIAMSRAVGESAPLIVIGAAGWVSSLPPAPVTARLPFLNFRWLTSDFTVLPIQMFTWSGDPDPRFQNNAAAAGLVLIAFTLTMNAIAIVVRYRVRRKIKW